jgi:transcriptional regulator with GAF, ATPase, and Fis domain
MSDNENEGPELVPDDLPGLATLLSTAALSWEEEGTLEDTLNAIALSAVDMVPGADYAGVSLVRPPHSISTPAATDDLVRAADAVQESLAEGPCVEATWQRRTVRVDDLATDPRWPRFGPKAVAIGVASMLAFRLFSGRDTWGALNLYSRQTNAFGASSEFVGQLFASHASIALAGSQEIGLLTIELNTRNLVERATGIMMERHHIGPTAALEMLATTVRASGRSLTDVSAWIAQGEPTSARTLERIPRTPMTAAHQAITGP